MPGQDRGWEPQQIGRYDEYPPGEVPPDLQFIDVGWPEGAGADRVGGTRFSGKFGPLVGADQSSADGGTASRGDQMRELATPADARATDEEAEEFYDRGLLGLGQFYSELATQEVAEDTTVRLIDGSVRLLGDPYGRTRIISMIAPDGSGAPGAMVYFDDGSNIFMFGPRGENGEPLDYDRDPLVALGRIRDNNAQSPEIPEYILRHDSGLTVNADMLRVRVLSNHNVDGGDGHPYWPSNPRTTAAQLKDPMDQAMGRTADFVRRYPGARDVAVGNPRLWEDLQDCEEFGF